MAIGIKTGGRTKGTLNKTTTETKEVLTKIVCNELDNLNDLLEQLEPKERLDVIIKLLPYIVPKQTEMTVENKETEIKPVVIEFIDSKEIESICNNLENKY